MFSLGGAAPRSWHAAHRSCLSRKAMLYFRQSASHGPFLAPVSAEGPVSSVQHIYLSPHFDDAVLSCGGQISLLARAGEPVVVATVFGGKPNPEQLSPFAAAIHARPHAGADPVANRRREDQRALAVLGAVGRPGDYLDCLYRQDESGTRWLYASEEALFGPISSTERGLAYELAQAFASLAPEPGRCRLYAPLALGNHVDHQHVNRAALHLQRAGYVVRYYEDYPYIIREETALQARLGKRLERWQAEVIALDKEAMRVKVEAVSAYRSQLGVLFGSGGRGHLADVAPAMEAFGRQVAQDANIELFAERLWRLRPLELATSQQQTEGTVGGLSDTHDSSGPQREESNTPEEDATLLDKIGAWLSALLARI